MGPMGEIYFGFPGHYHAAQQKGVSPKGRDALFVAFYKVPGDFIFGFVF
jgi:hypothetical protein